jgi:geranylgeranyl diphosphate synthase type I
MSSPSVKIEQLLESRASMIDRELNLLSYAIEPPELAEIIRYALAQRGKKIRASMLTLTCEAVGGNLAKALVPAVVVEMIHNTSLILDDVIDASDTRRGRKTINSMWGNNMALIACDAMLALAIRQASRSDAQMTSSIIECASTSLLCLAEGEAMELVKKDYTTKDYFRIAERKTASLFRASAEVGALVGGGSPREVEALGHYGNSVGVAFQIKDDILDVMSSNDVLGKPTLIDLRMDRPTLVMLLAREDGLSRDTMMSMSQEELRKALAPSVERAEALAGKKVAEAKGYLNNVRDSPARDRLVELGDFVMTRKK